MISSDFQFLHPFWFIAIFLLIAIFFYKGMRFIKNTNLIKIADKHLIQYLTASKQGVQLNQINKTHQFNQTQSSLDLIKRLIQPFLFRLGLFLTALFLIISLASPVWQKLPTPIFDGGYHSLVIVLDLSQSMNAQDLLPNRLERAKFKIREILKYANVANNKKIQTQQNSDFSNRNSENGSHLKTNDPIEIGLIVYSDLAYVVSPITNNVQSIEPLIDALDTNLMPTYGSRLQTGLNKASQLLNQSGIKHGNILVISDSVQSANFREMQSIASQHKIHLLAAGTNQGAKIPSAKGGFVEDLSGKAVISKLNLDLMRAFNQFSNGRFEIMTLDNLDIKRIIDALQSNQEDSFVQEQENADVYRQEYFWFLLIAMAIFLTYFRKGAFILMALPIMFSPFETQASVETENVLFSKDWNGVQSFKSGNYQQAINQFKDQRWKASSLFKDGKYKEALELWNNFDGDDDFYNQGNSYAMLGEFQKAIESYEKAIEINPEHQKAIENKKRISDYLENQKNNQNQEDKENQQNQQGQQNNQSTQNEKNSENSQGGQDGESNPSNQQGGNDQKDQNQSQSDQSNEKNNQSNQSDEPKEGSSENSQSQGSADDKNQKKSNESNESNESANTQENSTENQEENQKNATSSKSQDQQNQQEQSQNQGQSSQQQNDSNFDSNSKSEPNPKQFDEKIGNQKINQDPINPADNNKNNKQDSTQPSNNQVAGENPSERELKDKEQNQENQSSQAIITPNINSEQAEKQIYLMQKLQQVEDDPGELLRRKFLYQYKNQNIAPDLLNQPY